MLKTYILYVFQAEELRYVYQRIGFQCFTETLFEDAGKHLFNGELDPRLLVSYYPELRGNLFTADDVMDVFAGVAEHMPQENSVDDISESLSHSPSPSAAMFLFLELIFSCVKSSQELLTSLVT